MKYNYDNLRMTMTYLMRDDGHLKNPCYLLLRVEANFWVCVRPRCHIFSLITNYLVQKALDFHAKK